MNLFNFNLSDIPFVITFNEMLLKSPTEKRNEIGFFWLLSETYSEQYILETSFYFFGLLFRLLTFFAFLGVV